jgi:hypothetical protein
MAAAASESRTPEGHGRGRPCSTPLQHAHRLAWAVPARPSLTPDGLRIEQVVIRVVALAQTGSG